MVISGKGQISKGTQLDGNTIAGGTSRPAFKSLFARIQVAMKHEKVFLTMR